MAKKTNRKNSVARMRNALRNPTPAQHFKKAQALFEKNGQIAVFDYANKQKIGYEYCKACHTNSPSLRHVCLVCGQATDNFRTDKPKKSAWDFVEENYPNYHTSQEIANNDDLHKLVNGEGEAGDSASKLLDKEYGGDERNPHIQLDLNESLVRIYELSIENFLANQKS